MRLTLRTLLAWLDDTLTPSEVREIGQQVAESPFARDLVARIQKVTRQRRLTIPRGDDAVDPNIVAAYLDNELEPEEVTNFEKVCLTSDVHLAEAASVHQILSLIGQKAKVPVGARERMYRRVKGRESRAVASNVPVGRPAPQTPVTPPMQGWGTPAPMRRSLAEKFGPVVATLGLLGVLVWSAWMSVTPSGDKARVANDPADFTKPKAQPNLPAVAAKPAAVVAAEPKDAEEMPAEPAPATDAKAVAVDPGVFGVVSKSDSVLLRYELAPKDWERVEGNTNLRAGDLLVNLTPGRTEFTLPKSSVLLIGQGEVQFKAQAAAEAAHIVLRQGKMVVKTPVKGETLGVEVGSMSFAIGSEQPVKVGIGRELARSFPATPLSSAVVALIAVPEGEVTVTFGTKTEKITGPKVVILSSDSDIIDSTDFPTPGWIEDTTTPIVEAGLAKTFSQYLANKRPVPTSLAEASEDELPEVRGLAIKALGLLGDLSLVIPVLRQSGSSPSRQATIEVLRDYRARGAEEAESLWEQLRKTYGDVVGRKIEKLVIGYSALEAQDEANLAKLVAMLADPDIAVRELALDNLKVITHRDAMEYDPEKPDGKGLRAWQEALKSKTLTAPQPIDR